MVKINEGGHWECSESGDYADGEKKCGNKSDTAVPRPALPWNYGKGEREECHFTTVFVWLRILRLENIGGLNIEQSFFFIIFSFLHYRRLTWTVF